MVFMGYYNLVALLDAYPLRISGLVLALPMYWLYNMP